nr:unnamed protein product [Callosobruchus analis]
MMTKQKKIPSRLWLGSTDNAVQDITSKWRSIRDNYEYIRNRRKIKESTRSGAAAKKIRRYIYEEQLRFLEKSIAMRPTVSTISEESQSSQQNAEDDTENSGSEESEDGQQAVGTITTPTTSRSAPIKRTKKIGIEEHLLNFMEAHKPKNAHQPIVEDDDLAFFFSLLPMVKSLTIDEKYTFRMESMKLLQEIKKSRNTPRRLNTFQYHSDATVSQGTNFSDSSQVPSAGSYFSQFSPNEQERPTYHTFQ